MGSAGWGASLSPAGCIHRSDGPTDRTPSRQQQNQPPIPFAGYRSSPSSFYPLHAHFTTAVGIFFFFSPALSLFPSPVRSRLRSHYSNTTQGVGEGVGGGGWHEGDESATTAPARTTQRQRKDVNTTGMKNSCSGPACRRKTRPGINAPARSPPPPPPPPLLPSSCSSARALQQHACFIGGVFGAGAGPRGVPPGCGAVGRNFGGSHCQFQTLPRFILSASEDGQPAIGSISGARVISCGRIFVGGCAAGGGSSGSLVLFSLFFAVVMLLMLRFLVVPRLGIADAVHALRRVSACGPKRFRNFGAEQFFWLLLLFGRAPSFGRSVDRCVVRLHKPDTVHRPLHTIGGKKTTTPSVLITCVFFPTLAHQRDASHACRRGQTFGLLRIRRVEHHAAELVGPRLSADSREGVRRAEVVGLVVSGPAVKRGRDTAHWFTVVKGMML